MKQFLTSTLLFLCLFVGSLSAQQTVQVIHMDDLESWFQKDDDVLYVINFWATWCRPCVAELPYFDDLGKHYKDKPVQVLLVSLDFVDDLESRVQPFLKKKKPKSAVYLLDEDKPNQWIGKVDETWSGAIPATIFVNKKQDIRVFHEGDFTKEELFEKVESLMHRK